MKNCLKLLLFGSLYYFESPNYLKFEHKTNEMFFDHVFSFKRIVEYTADEHSGFNAVVRREPVDVKVIKKVYEPEVVKHVAPVAPVKYIHPEPHAVKYYAPQQEAAPVGYYAPQPQAIVASAPKLFTPSVHQKVIAPVVKQYVTPQLQYYQAPEHPKFYGKPVERVAKLVNPNYQYEPHHTAVKYASPAPHYNHY